MAEFDHLTHLENLECHFNWQLDCSQSTLENLLQDLQDRLNTGCNWENQLLNLLGYVLQTKGSSDEALAYLREAETMIREQRDEEQDCPLLINQANLAWVHYFRGELEESQAYLERVTKLQEAFPAPPNCELHPDIAGVKGWSLLKFEKNHKQQAIECFKMALTGNPLKRHFHKGLALAMEKGYSEKELTPDLKREIVEKLRAAKEMDENDVCLEALYLINALDANVLDREEALNETNALVDKLIDSGRLDGLSNVLYLLTYHFKENDRALDVADRMLRNFPNSTRAKKNLVNCLKWKVFSLPQENEERINLAERAIGLLNSLKTLTVKGNINLAILHKELNNIAAAEEIFKTLLKQESLSDAEKQLLYLRYGQYLHHVKETSSESAGMYLRAVQISVASDNRDQCFQYLMKNLNLQSPVGNDVADDIYQSLLQIGHLSDAEKQLLYLRYVQYLYKSKAKPSEAIDMNIKAVQIPVPSENRDRCFQYLMSIIAKASQSALVNEAADHIYQSLLEHGHLSDAEKQLLYLQYGQYLYHAKDMNSESTDMYMKAVKIPGASANRDKSFQYIMVNLKKANMNPRVEDISAADRIYQRLFQIGHLSDVEKQLLYLRYGQYLYFVQENTSEALDMYMRAVQIPVESKYKDQCIEYLKKNRRM